MIYGNLEFHNTAELEETTGTPGLTIQRFPRAVRNHLGKDGHQRGRYVSQASTGCEIRFITESEFIRITLSATIEDGDVIVYNGDFFHSFHRLQVGQLHTLHLDRPSGFDNVEASMLYQGARFSPNVWRIMISRNYYPGLAFQVCFHKLETFGHSVRPPLAEELPARKLLAYGSSITHGSGATVQHLAYIQQTGRRLGMDVMNKGMGGSCFCEREIADYLMEHGQWNAAILELGVNMRGIFTAEEFERRARYLIEGMLTACPGKPVVLINILPNSANALRNPSAEMARINADFISKLQQLHRSISSPDLHLIDGHDLLTEFCTLANDLIHPSDFGHTMMGQHLSEKLRAILDPSPAGVLL